MQVMAQISKNFNATHYFACVAYERSNRDLNRQPMF